MHFSEGLIPLQFCYQFYGSLILVGIFGGFASFCLGLMAIYGIRGIELVLGFSLLGFFGLVRTLVLPLYTLVEIEDVYESFSLEVKHNLPKQLDELAVETRILKEANKEDAILISSTCNNASCSICLQCFEIGHEVSEVTSCAHRFHSKCLRMWIPTSATCPYCRQDLDGLHPSPKEEAANTNENANDIQSRNGMGHQLFRSLGISGVIQ